MARLQDSVIAVTGGGSGIGAAFCAAMAAEGALVAALDYDGDNAARTALSITRTGRRALGIGVDVRDRLAVREALDTVVREFGKLDVMFNNAGISLTRPFMETTEEDFRALHDVNVVGVLIGMQESARIFIRQGNGGKIVNTCSVAARQARQNYSSYAASKFAVHSLVQSGARALAEHGIVVTGFSPGIVDTPLWRATLGESSIARQSAFLEYASRIPAGRVSTPEDLIPVGIFLASHDSDYTTGQVVAVDGGMEMV